MHLTPYLRESLDAVGVAACEYDRELRAVAWNRSFCAFFPEHAGKICPGEPYAENLRRFYGVRLVPEEMAELERCVAEGIARHQTQIAPFRFSHHGRRLLASSLPTPEGGRLRLWRLLSRRSAPGASMALPAVAMLEFIPDGATVLDADNLITACNAQFRTLYDVPEEATIVGMCFVDVVRASWAAAGRPAPASELLANQLRYDGAPFEIELPGDRWRRVHARRDDRGTGFFTHADISVAKRQQRELTLMRDALRLANEELSRLASTDALTGLSNRREFDASLSSFAARREDVAVLVIDIDHFKSVNDRFGHVAGDEVLACLANQIETLADGSDIVASRIGGEEFALLLAGAEARRAAMLAGELLESVRRCDWRAIHRNLEAVTVSIGVGQAQGPVAPGLLYQAADRALYRAKRSGRDRAEVA